MKKANLYKGLAAVVMFFECIVLGFSVSAFQYAEVVNNALGVQTSEKVPIADGEVDEPVYYASKYAKDTNYPTDEEIAKKYSDFAALVYT